MSTLVKMLLHCPDVPPMTILGPRVCLADIHYMCGKTHNEYGLHMVPDFLDAAQRNLDLVRKIRGIDWDAQGKPLIDISFAVELGDACTADPKDYGYVFIGARGTLPLSTLHKFVEYSTNLSRISGVGYFDAYYARLG